jgi:aspartyl protease family protein
MPAFRLPAGLLLVAAAFILLFDQSVGNLAPDEAAILLGIGAIMFFMGGRIVDGFRRSGIAGLHAILLGGLTCAILVWGYASRSEVEGVLDRMIGDVAPGRIVTTPGGDVVAAKRLDGSFSVNTQVNGQAIRFTFDTGASTVVLRAEDAIRVGLKPETLSYTVPVSTANGMTLAAMVFLDTVAIGPISERRIPALVARPGVLHANLLGMTFLERLSSYEVRGNRLILRGKTQS